MYSTGASKRELAFTNGLRLGSKGLAVKRLQEWLNLAGNGITIDGDFGPATASALNKYQTAKGITPSKTPTLSAPAWSSLTQPMSSALDDSAAVPTVVSGACLKVARRHLAVHPLEVGGDNCGPWVRMYTGGSDGTKWRWCAGFVSFVMKQACSKAGVASPIKGSLSCDTLAFQSQVAGRFVSGKSLVADPSLIAALGPCAIFLVYRSPGDWSHTGFAFNFTDSTFETIEGNTNDEGSANGYEVCSRIRKLDGDKDFIRLN